eukprot:TRINITY_DN4054_c0_g1_i1.p1 TRINITY_DN4054_c0_g1~~TRINITY_DN4054_c0_g1_i1.p1  ORF type:complete len:152 (-),score=51.32 TRINITY_DN4054_c0_g1_i1:121-576(-)
MAAAVNVSGKWVLESTTGQFEEILTTQEVGWITRKMILAATPTVEIQQTADTLTMTMTAAGNVKKDTFAIGGKPVTVTNDNGSFEATCTIGQASGGQPAVVVTQDFAGKKEPQVQTTARYLSGDKMITEINLKTKDGKKNFSTVRTFKKAT